VSVGKAAIFRGRDIKASTPVAKTFIVVTSGIEFVAFIVKKLNFPVVFIVTN
jgi:hypothetical protein